VPNLAVAEALDTVGLTRRADIPVGALTAGERRLAALAAGLLTGPDLLFLEEPTSGLDPIGGAEMLRLLRDMVKGGKTVVMTTHLPAEAEQSDKVAVLADGGHLAFFGTPSAACDYFGADDLDEIYQRLAGVGDPVAAWSRRFFQSGRTPRAFTPVSPISPMMEEGSAVTSPLLGPGLEPWPGSLPAAPGSAETEDDFDPLDPYSGPLDPTSDEWRLQSAAGGAMAHSSSGLGRRWYRGMPRPLRPWALAVTRNADVLSRTRWLAAWLFVGPLAVALVTLSILFRAGPADAGMPLLWVAFSGLFSGLACGLPQVFPERPILRHDRLAGLGTASYALAKAAVLLPPLAAADALFLALLDLLGGQPGFASFVPVYVTLLLCSATALGLGLLASAAVPESRWVVLVIPAACFPLLLAGYGVAEGIVAAGGAAWPDWVALGCCTLAFFAASIRLLR
jgi:energy-coupling factor transporter ATP-binding protein EcfA2